MTQRLGFLDRYVALWNTPDAADRRQLIEELWRPDAELYTQYAYSGHDGIETRVTKAYEQFVRDQGYCFRSAKNGVGHHDAGKFNWEMLLASGGPVVSVGFDFFLLADDGRIRLEYQFNDPPVPSADLNELVDRYLGAWNESDPTLRAKAMADLFAADGELVTPTARRQGRVDVSAAIEEQRERTGGGLTFQPARNADGHHGSVRFNWWLAAGDGPAVEAGFDFLILDDDGRIRSDYRFAEAPPAGV